MAPTAPVSHPLPVNPAMPHAADGPFPPPASSRDDESPPPRSPYGPPTGSERLPPAAPVDPRVADALHRLLVSSVQDYAIYGVTVDGRVATWNAGAERLKGYTADEVIGQPLSLFYPQELRGADGLAPRAMELLRTAAAEGRAEDEEWRVRKDGTRFWAHVIITPVHDQAGVLIGFAKVTRDLTARRAAEAHALELAAEQAARAEAQRAEAEARVLTERLQEQAVELEAQTEEAQCLTEELEITNEQLEQSARSAEEARQRAMTLQEVTASLAKAHSTADVGHVFSRELTTILGADTAWVGIMTPEGDAVGALGWAGYSDAAAAHWRRLPLDAGVSLTDVVRSGKAQWWASRSEFIAAYPARAGVIISTEQESVAVLPLLDESSQPRADDVGRILGGIVIGFRTRQELDHDVQAFFLALAQQCAHAIVRARAFEAEQEAGTRAQRLQLLTARLNRATSSAEIADAIFDGTVRALDADAGSLALVVLDADGRPVEFETVRVEGYGEAIEEHYRRFPFAPGRPVSDAIVRRQPLFITSAEEWRAHYPEVADQITPLGYQALVAIPVFSGNRPLAALSFSFRTARSFDAATRTFLATISEQCALALERQRLHELEIRQAEQHAALLESMQDAFIACDHELRYTYLNAPAEAIIRRTASEVLGRRVLDVFPEVAGTPLYEAIRHTLATGESVDVEAYGVAAHRWLEARTYPTPDGVVFMARDVSVRRRAQDAAQLMADASELLASSLDYETTLRAVAEVLVPRLGDWCAVDVIQNPAAHVWPPQVERLAVVHRDPTMVERAEELERRYPTDWATDTGMSAVLRTGTPFLVPEVTDAMIDAGARDTEHLALLRAMHFSSIMVVPLIARGLTLGALTLCMAESGRRYEAADLALAEELAQRAATAIDNARLFRDAARARAEAEAANRAKSQFLATMSHELRTPLNAIGGYAELMEMEIRGPITVEQRDDLARIQRSQKHLLGLINEVLNYARIESGTVHYDITEVGVIGALTGIESLVLPQIRAKDLRLEIVACDPSVAVLADAEKLRQVLLNLLANAIKFTPEGGKITLECRVARSGDHLARGAHASGIAARRERDAVEIIVSDTGIGIAADQLDEIFEPFVQIGRALNSPGAGTGLGLAISRDLARGMGGELTAESRPSVGSSFSLVLPRAG